MLVGISGIDASGKGYVTAKLADALTRKFKLAVLNVDGWLNLPHVRFNDNNPGVHFYHHALRLDDMFDQLVLPLKHNRSVRMTADFAEETASIFRSQEYVFDEIDIILLEGIFLFKLQHLHHFDLKIWIDCSFERALTRAVARSQEGLLPAETRYAYAKYYFPAQRIHFETDDPQSSADVIYPNH